MILKNIFNTKNYSMTLLVYNYCWVSVWAIIPTSAGWSGAKDSHSFCCWISRSTLYPTTGHFIFDLID